MKIFRCVGLSFIHADSKDVGSYSPCYHMFKWDDDEHWYEKVHGKWVRVSSFTAMQGHELREISATSKTCGEVV